MAPSVTTYLRYQRVAININVFHKKCPKLVKQMWRLQEKNSHEDLKEVFDIFVQLEIKLFIPFLTNPLSAFVC